MKLIFILTLPVLVGHGHLQHMGTRLEGSSCLRYHACFFSSFIFLEDANSFLLMVRLFSICPVQPTSKIFVINKIQYFNSKNKLRNYFKTPYWMLPLLL